MTHIASTRRENSGTGTHAAHCVACQGVRSHAVPVALVGEVLHPRQLRTSPSSRRVLEIVAHLGFSLLNRETGELFEGTVP
jgi:hypothetical protein